MVHTMYTQTVTTLHLVYRIRVPFSKELPVVPDVVPLVDACRDVCQHVHKGCVHQSDRQNSFEEGNGLPHRLLHCSPPCPVAVVIRPGGGDVAGVCQDALQGHAQGMDGLFLLRKKRYVGTVEQKQERPLSLWSVLRVMLRG